ncbi:sigma-70 family RNA polymerase sigma factor [Streptomyces sp. NPDC047117]|uniref:sigma-70 family RNA polymerase sigma factor n=1 Tax=unclassified Streptomyces TaxID=2593676 RepID=UPI0033F3A60E
MTFEGRDERDDRGVGAGDVAGSGHGAGPQASRPETVPQQRIPGADAAGAADQAPPGTEPGAPPSDTELVSRMRAGDDSAYEELYRRHADAVRRYARTCCRDAHTAEDLTGEVFARTLQAVRRGAGPKTAVRAYLLTTVRRAAADWVRTAKREHLVEDFAVFASSAAGASMDDDTLDLGADVRAMHEAERSMAVRAFRSLPERYQTVLWHTTVEKESPSEVAPLLGLSANATAVLAHRAREGLKQAYLQAHVSASLTSGGDCARYADRLGAYARGGLRVRAERGLRKHLEECARCRLAAHEVADVNQRIGAVLPVAVIGWFAAGYAVKAAAGVVGAAGAGAAAGTGAAAAAGGSGHSAGAGAAAEGLGTPAKVGIGAGLTVAAAGVAMALAGLQDPPKTHAEPPPPAPSSPAPQKPEPKPTPKPEPPAPEPAPPKPAPPKPKPKPKPTPTPEPPKPAPKPEPTPPPKPKPTPPPKPAPKPTPPPPAAPYPVNTLDWDFTGDDSKPEVRTTESSFLWKRQSGVSIGGKHYAHGVTTHAPSSVTIDLNRECTAFDAYAGVDDLGLGRGAVRFSVYADGVRQWSSGVVHGGDAAVPVHVPLSGRTTLRLVAEPQKPADTLAFSDWAQSQISCR